MASFSLPDRTRQLLTRVAMAFFCGALGGFCIGVGVPLTAAFKVTDLLGVAIHPQLTKAFLYSKIVWGGIWGPIMLLPLPFRPILRGCILGAFGPGLVQLLIVFPLKETPGSLAGLTLGALTPLLVLFFNSCIWGIPTSLTFHLLTSAPVPSTSSSSSRPMRTAPDVLLDPEDPDSKFS